MRNAVAVGPLAPLHGSRPVLTPAPCGAQAGADTSRQPEGETLLHIAAQRGELKLVEALMGAGARLLEVDCHGRTALHRSLQQHHLPVIRVLYRATREYLSEDLERMIEEYIPHEKMMTEDM